MKSIQTLLVLALFAAGIMAVGCGETATTETEPETTPVSANSDAPAEGDHANHEHKLVSLKLPGMT